MMLEAHGTMDRIFHAFRAGQRIISMNTPLKLTKTQKGLSEALLVNDVELAADVQAWIAKRADQKQILARYGQSKLPHHFPARILSGLGSICSGQNIFLFFPECLGVEGRTQEHFFGIELIDIWSNIFQKTVFPCTRVTFNADTQVELLSQLGSNLDKTIYLASIFHELGHQRGSWRVSPTTDTQLKISSFYLDVLGEMSTDSMLVNRLTEFPECSAFVVLQRLFWFGRRGFCDNPISARINHDNDSWLSALLWNRLRAAGALSYENNRWSLDSKKMAAMFLTLESDLELVGQECLTLPNREAQDAFALEWMKNEVSYIEETGFVLPTELRNVYRACSHIEEIPHFQPLAEPIDLRRFS